MIRICHLSPILYPPTKQKKCTEYYLKNSVTQLTGKLKKKTLHYQRKQIKRTNGKSPN